MAPAHLALRNPWTFFVVALLTTGVAGCDRSARHGPAVAQAAARTPAADPFHLGSHSFTITTTSSDAQHAFDRGLTLAYGFSHGSAEREFRKAVEADPQAAMPWWGIALVNGPHINFPLVPPEKAAVAWDALSKARNLAAATSPLEQALIRALATRYANPQPEDRKPLDDAYARAMAGVWRSFPTSADVATLYAEAMMDLRPWDLWTAEGRPQPGTTEILATLERALELAPRHPGANHLYVHTVEASPEPQKAMTAADRLLDIAPGVSHLVHMPSHIYARVGRWEAAADSNSRAMLADVEFRKTNPRPGFYAMYMAHNGHFFAYAQIMRGHSAEALRAARQMVRSVPEEFLRDFAPVVDGYMVFVPQVLMRFGRWEEILAEPAPPAHLPLSQALWRFTRAVSLTALDRWDAAIRERDAFRAAARAVPPGWTFGNNSAADILEIATATLDGEMAARRDRFAESERLLRKAIAVEDRLRYDEPPDWMQPVRHTLGAVLLRAGEYAKAEAVYREDLARYPENGWSLFGLARALRLQKKEAEATAVDARFSKVWSGADVKLGSTCFCQPGV